MKPRVYAILDTGVVPEDKLLPKLHALIAAEVDIIQFRAKGKDTQWCTQQLDVLYPVVEKSGIPFIVNDSVELALRYPQAGLHIGQDDGDPVVVRKQLGPDRMLGYSTHNLEQAKEAMAFSDTLDYFAIGPIFNTQSKDTTDATVGLSLIQEIAALKPTLPFYAIGGIKRSNVNDVIRSGANGVALIADILAVDDTESAVGELKGMILSI